MKEMIAIKALSGGGLKSDTRISGKMANVFAVNDKSQACGFRIVSMATIYNHVAHHLDEINITPDITRKVWENRYANTGAERITNLLGQIRKYKINASISFKAIQTAMF